MASKSKKRRRVFRASCILAALIIAGSSFAWFTSSDEVTNRLSANADYGVSIVESFAPPENWLPGQQVNKDVYAVNTGNVAAFVEETVSGVLTITKEVPDGQTPTADSIKLSAAEVYVMEDGSYLAYKPEKSNLTLGNKVVAMNPDFKNQENYTAADGNFGPDAAGLYVFRRSIGVDPTTKIETFKYEGYYFDGHDFYKVENLEVVPDGASYAGDNVYTDGNLTDATYTLVKEETTVVNPVDLRYEAKTADHPNRLVAVYGTGQNVTNGALDTLAKNYDDALVAYQDALKEYAKASNESGTADQAVIDANTALQNGLNDLRDKANDLQDARDALKDAQDALDAAESALTAAQNKVSAAQQAVNNAQAAVDAAELTVAEKQADVDAAKVDLYGYSDGGTTNGESDTKTDGTDSEGYYKSTSKYGKWKVAKDALDAADQNEYNAFVALFNDYVNAAYTTNANDPMVTYEDVDNTDPEHPVVSRVKVDLDHVTYEQLEAMHLENNMGTDPTNDPRYNYYELVIAEKKAKEALEDAQDVLSDAEVALALATEQKGNADTALGTAQGKLATAEDELGNPTDVYVPASGSTPASGDTAYGRYNKAANDVDDAMVDLYGYPNGGEDELADGLTYDDTDATTLAVTADKYTSSSAYGEWKAQDIIVNGDSTASPPTTGLQGAWQDAVTAAGATGASGNLAEAADNVAVCQQALADAQAAYENAMNTNTGELKININLSDDVTTTGGVADKWQLLPASLVDTNNDTNVDTARFYYTSILGAGETTSMLIDSVELDNSVTADMFKRFDFDLNVALKSAQIALDNDGQTILTTAADNTLDATATLAAPTNVDTAITWAVNTPATPSSYTSAGATYKPTSSDAGTATDVVITRLDTPITIGSDTTTYPYMIERDNKKFYGTALTADTTFVQATGTTSPLTAGEGTIKLNANATAATT